MTTTRLFILLFFYRAHKRTKITNRRKPVKNVEGSDQRDTAGKSERKSDRILIPVPRSTINSEIKSEKYESNEAGAGRGLTTEIIAR